MSVSEGSMHDGGGEERNHRGLQHIPRDANVPNWAGAAPLPLGTHHVPCSRRLAL